MCMVSVITAYGQKQVWQDIIDTIPNYTPSAIEEAEKIRTFQELVAKADEWDRKNNQPDCIDASKAEFLVGLEKRLAAIERKLDQLTHK